MLRTRTECHLKAAAYTARSSAPVTAAIALMVCSGAFLPRPSLAARAQVGLATATGSAQATAKAQHEIEAVIRLQGTAMEHKDVEGADPQGATHLPITLDEYTGLNLLDTRAFCRAGEEWKPGKRMSLRHDHLALLKRAIAAVEKATKETRPANDR